MASAALGDELSCSICLNLYTEPVSLRCGHIFCRDCIVTALDTQEGSGVYSCPECREEYVERPTLEKNRKLCNIVDNFRSTQQKEEKSEILCTYCVDSPVGAVKTCLHCETSMCDKHLTAHNKTVDHVLVEPTLSFSSKKCSIHKKLLEYFCSKDSTYLCVSCCLVGKHKGHEVELLEEALEKKKEKLNCVLRNLTTTKEKTEQEIQSLQDQKRIAEEKADDEKKRVTALFEDMRRQLEVQEQRVLSEISRQVEEVSQSVDDLIKQLEIQKDELSGKIGHFEKLCNMTDPITVLQNQESDTGDQNVEESSVHNLDDFLTSLVLHRSITDLIANMQLNTNFNIQDATDLLLDVKTANTVVALSDDLRTASSSETEKNRPALPQRFTLYSQVMSMESFSHGRHYWEVEVGDCGNWDVGVCYPSIQRDGEKSGIGKNTKSWCFGIFENAYSCEHDSQYQNINLNSPVRRLGLYLDYEGGRLSFYHLSDPIRHLHTFTTTFTEPLHAVFYLDDGAWVKLVSKNGVCCSRRRAELLHLPEPLYGAGVTEMWTQLLPGLYCDCSGYTGGVWSLFLSGVQRGGCRASYSGEEQEAV
ncbi:E3 ubiquitin-protein ligase TRIM39-like isoform X1 [Aquarana catesbeiana]|uniref:E3 ubiquitin-protein ligase TRIM39-like isoform X1 n=1 Tax=Aquarana catesbeiana TaxID=8400 RepID=UPI003CC97189